ncbi:Hypothetical protein PHPALM_11678 [Phytophthora palmivora]|uniref:Uncharacterized protein n=1 Tax=Phytophthora palmivora TaxID=4796 RepID=A0A2P4Y1Q2_9STRA|nr:Hypothetical protein PHPALM_11678 [Phytophthora palmivora]
MATQEEATLALTVEEGKTRDLYNALRTDDHGVSLEALAQALYFLQNEEFTLFEVKNAFRSSIGANERFLAYREFQIALSKIARVKYYGSGKVIGLCPLPKQHARPTELELMCLLVDQLTIEHQNNQLDTLRRQMTRCSAIDTLEQKLPLLVQSFQLYGSQNRLSTNLAESMLSTITLDGFVDFLNAYFEYEEFFSFDDLSRMTTEVLSGFARRAQTADAKSSKDVPDSAEGELNFAQFLELFCRVASAFHHKLLAREGAQLRRAIESCRLEFSLEVLLDHMQITLIPNDDPLAGSAQLPGQDIIKSDMKDLATVSTPRGDEVPSMLLVIQNIRDILRLDASDQTKKPKSRLKREGSLVTQGQLSRRSSSNQAEQAPSGGNTLQQLSKAMESRKPPPQVAMIREVIMPPSLPADVIQLLESALKFQNITLYNMALSALDSCKQRYLEQYPPPSDDQPSDVDPIHLEVLLFFTLQAASVYDSAHRDTQALSKYYEAMTLARQLPAHHPGRQIVKSCAGVTLFYAGELVLAQQCHQLVLDARKTAPSSNSCVDDYFIPSKQAAVKTDSNSNCSLVDFATTLNNLACCLSQDQSETTSKSLDSAYLMFKHARQIYTDAFGPSHPRVGLISRNLDRVRACQNGVVSDAAGALARGEYRHVIPGSRFQIQALEYVAKPAKSSGKAGGKKKKKGAK